MTSRCHLCDEQKVIGIHVSSLLAAVAIGLSLGAIFSRVVIL